MYVQFFVNFVTAANQLTQYHQKGHIVPPTLQLTYPDLGCFLSHCAYLSYLFSFRNISVTSLAF